MKTDIDGLPVACQSLRATLDCDYQFQRDLYPQNLMSEYHLRYGGYGGVGYYLVADNYVALMSRWTTCGAWEGHAILDFLRENESDVKPDTIHADTQGQSNAIFGLAYLLGIQLLPRIRDWKGRTSIDPLPRRASNTSIRSLRLRLIGV
jgi:TnpA family transposase